MKNLVKLLTGLLSVKIILFSGCSNYKLLEKLSSTPKVSILVATYDKRHDFHELLWQSFLAQNYNGDMNLLVYDNGAQPSKFFSAINDSRLIYKYTSKTPHELSLGAKRNWLLENAPGEFIIIWDDDDFYGENYVSFVLAHAQKNSASLVKPIKWLMAHFDKTGKKIEYHFVKPDFTQYGWGFGFAYVKQVAQSCSYGNSNIGEEDSFAQCIEKNYGHVIRTEWNQLEKKPSQLKFDSITPRKARTQNITWQKSYAEHYENENSFRHPELINYDESVVVQKLGQEKLLKKYIEFYRMKEK